MKYICFWDWLFLLTIIPLRVTHAVADINSLLLLLLSSILWSEKAMTLHSSTLAWKITRTEEPGGLHSVGSIKVGHDWVTSLSPSCIGEENGKPLQCSCLENPRDWGAWWAAIYGVAQSRTRLKQPGSSSWMVLSLGNIVRPNWSFVLLNVKVLFSSLLLIFKY